MVSAGRLTAASWPMSMRSHSLVGQSSEWMTWGDSYELNITNPSDEIIALAVVLTIDCVMEAAATAASSS